MRRTLAVLLVLSPVVAAADVVVLKGGRRLSGVLVDKNERTVVLEMGPGRVSLPLAQVERIETGQSSLASFQDRAARIGAGDAESWAELGEWARSAGLSTQSREAFERALAIDPGNATAHRGLGDVLLPQGWATGDEARRAQGLVPFEGAWVTPEERRATLEERADARREALERRDAEARVREAEARAEAAEAEARRVRAEAESAAVGVPYGWVASGCGFNCGNPGHPHGRPPVPPPVTTPPPPPPPPVTTPPVRVVVKGSTAKAH